MFLSSLSPAYWKSAAGELKNLRRLVFAALICALTIVIGALFITVGDNLRVKFTFFVTALGSAVYGPIVAILVGAVSDTLGYLLFPSGAYFPGYALSAMLGGLIYALFLYRKRVTILRLFAAKFLVNYLVNVGLGSLWSQILYGKGYLYYMTTSLVKNTLLLPFEVIALAALFAVITPAFARLGLLPGHEKADLQKLTGSAAVFAVFGLCCLAAGGASLYYSTTQTAPTLFRVIGIVLLAAGIALLILGGVIRRRQAGKEETP